jgi:uncharacterized protein (DUF2141 family)
MALGKVLTRRASMLGVLVAALVCERSAVAEESVATNVIAFRTQTRNAKGVVRCGLFREAGWLKKAVQPSIVKINTTTALCVFKEIPAGVYGISAFPSWADAQFTYKGGRLELSAVMK